MRWGTFALVDATRALLRAALRDPANQRLVLLSESGVPLYPPAATHQQLLAERRSRINACANPGVRVRSDTCCTPLATCHSGCPCDACEVSVPDADSPPPLPSCMSCFACKIVRYSI